MLTPTEYLQAHQRCRRCVEHGLLEHAIPIVAIPPHARVLLIGQAPGVTEIDRKIPFSGRAGATLWRWLGRAGFGDEKEARARIAVTAVTNCYPGRATSGDRVPSAKEIALCNSWKTDLFFIMQPRMVLLVGLLSIHQYFPKGTLNDLLGHQLHAAPLGNAIVLVLPHPSGQSRWHNDPMNRTRLEEALTIISETWQEMETN